MSSVVLIAILIGLALMLGELILPGGISFCLGLSTIIVALCYEMGWIQSPFSLFFAWCFISFIFCMISAFLLRKYFSGESVEEWVDEKDGTIGDHAIVEEQVNPQGGRVRFRGTLWKAVSLSKTFEPGTQVLIAGQDNQTLIVEEDDESIYQNISK